MGGGIGLDIKEEWGYNELSRYVFWSCGNEGISWRW